MPNSRPRAGDLEPWHLDKRVPIAMILALLAQTGGMIWWAASISTRVDDQSRRVMALEGSRETVQTIMSDLRADTAVLRSEAAATRRHLDRIERLLGRAE